MSFGIPVRNGLAVGLMPSTSLVSFLASFSPATLFAAGEQGVWYDPSDFTTLFQDSAGTVPVTATGQVVGLIKDKSGRNNNAAQSGADSLKPVLQQDSTGRYYLNFSNNFLVTGNINFGVNVLTACVGVRKLSDASLNMLMEFSASAAANNGTFYISAPDSSGGIRSYGCLSKGTLSAVARTAVGAYPAPITNVVTLMSSIPDDSVVLRVNQTQTASSTADQGTGNYGNFPLYIGRRGGATLPFTGRLYSMVVRGATTPLSTILNLEKWVNSRTGAY